LKNSTATPNKHLDGWMARQNQQNQQNQQSWFAHYKAT
jgi:hypothetical protein